MLNFFKIIGFGFWKNWAYVSLAVLDTIPSQFNQLLKPHWGQALQGHCRGHTLLATLTDGFVHSFMKKKLDRNDFKLAQKNPGGW